MLTLAVIAKDEADRIGACLASVPWASERLVLDSGSGDDTVRVAEASGAQVISTDWPGHVAQKNRALEEVGGEWVLSLDADERLSPEAAVELEAALAEPGDAAGFSLPRRSSWLGHDLRHGRWGRERKVRVVRRGRGRWEGDDPHDRLVVDGPVRALSAPILHDPYRSLSEHLGTIDRYTRRHAQVLHARGVRARWWHFALRPPLHLVDAYLLRMGFLDGVPGLAVAVLGAMHVFLKWLRLWRLGR